MTREEATTYIKEWLKDEYLDSKDRAALTVVVEELEQESGWIPVSERLPEIDVEVLVTDDAGGLATVHSDFCSQQYVGNRKRFWYASQCVTAWKPLPKPYSHEESEV